MHSYNEQLQSLHETGGKVKNLKIPFPGQGNKRGNEKEDGRPRKKEDRVSVYCLLCSVPTKTTE